MRFKFFPLVKVVKKSAKENSKDRDILVIENCLDHCCFHPVGLYMIKKTRITAMISVGLMDQENNTFGKFWAYFQFTNIFLIATDLGKQKRLRVPVSGGS